ncbi:MBL fold metallo-hydrolase [Bacteroidota bacterium]
MILTIFQSEQGDCLMVSSDNKNILIDGGMSESYRKHVAPALAGLRNTNQVIDLVCVSHIDQDHILGILTMLDDEMDWRTYDYQQSIGNNRAKRPDSDRPPNITEIWHNAFHEQVSDNNGKIEDMLAAYSILFSDSEVRDELERNVSSYATSVRQAILLSRRIRAKQLNIPLNIAFNNKLVTADNSRSAVMVGNMNITVIGPHEEDLEELRDKWNNWLRKNQKALRNISRNAHNDERGIGNESIPWLGLMDSIALELGDRSNVTVPNLASIMFLIEQDGISLLMTGDGHWKDILKGLKAKGKLKRDGSIHVNILKVQHHGSEHNLNEEFCRRVTADHYVFCGDGSHHNPDLRVVETIIQSRISQGEARAVTREVSDQFTLWFNSSSQITKDENKEHMRELEDMVKEHANAENQIQFHFMPRNRSNLEINL